MQNVLELATSYAKGKGIKSIDTLVAQAYADGYRDGYKEGKADNPANLDSNISKFIDLGLPSGTLWSTSFEFDKEYNVMFLTYEEALNYNIPTVEQWRELINHCNIEKLDEYIPERLTSFTFTSPNGNSVIFKSYGHLDGVKAPTKDCCRIWLREDNPINGFDKYSGIIEYNKQISTVNKSTELYFQGYKLPLRLVRSK